MNNDLSLQLINKNNIETLVILKKLIAKYTFGESSSVKVEVAENLLQSIHYSIDAYVSGCSQEEGLITLQSEGITEIYEKGLNIVKLCLEECKGLYKNVIDNKLQINIQAYNDTLHTAIPYFLRDYNCLYNAHETICCIDYPLAIDDMDIQGVFYIRKYLETIMLENKFCNYFINEIDEVLSCYGQLYKLNYSEALINVFEIVINNYIFFLIAENKGISIHISKVDYEMIVSKISNLEREDLNKLLDNIFKEIAVNLDIKDKALIHYIEEYKSVFSDRLISNIKHGSLKYMVIVDDTQKLQEINLLDTDDRMDDDSFKELVNTIQECNDTQDIINIIKNNVKSLIDFIDILKADCLFGEETFYSIFNILNDMELAILGKVVYDEELRYREGIDLLLIDIGDREKEWEIYYDDFIKDLDKDRIKNIKWLMSNYNIVI
ncbi:DUF6179 domain-containing protein [Vallitalea guaymasensis]|uniref:Uncharacterized protein n=1 Tax=Vallitalea guaymasensis TaxID=1185412 RepID=A0A8J8M7P6_9FIRM|nr:DUF6179 domain-containing protein [Vallitalea guaymasensis]QUH27856.1 hypothetical protein HYG85_02570 [Vallitalea guaymasensis]